MDIEFSFGKQDTPGRYTAYVEWSGAEGVSRRLAYETASTIFESIVCWKGWPHLDDATPLPKLGWTHTMETIEGDGLAAERHVLTFIFESMLDQLQFVSWWDELTVELEENVVLEEEGAVLEDWPVLDTLPEADEPDAGGEAAGSLPHTQTQLRPAALA